VLGHYCGVDWRELPLAARLCHAGRARPRFEAAAAVQQCAALLAAPRGPVDGDNIGVTRWSTPPAGKRCSTPPAWARWTPPVWAAMQAADCVLVDGTFWTDDEMIRLGLSRRPPATSATCRKRPRRHDRSWLDKLPATTRKVLIHINNTNPILDEDSRERRRAQPRTASRSATTAWRSTCERPALDPHHAHLLRHQAIASSTPGAGDPPPTTDAPAWSPRGVRGPAARQGHAATTSTTPST
jgi:coenzyme PQQ biosynthesis protein B